MIRLRAVAPVRLGGLAALGGVGMAASEGAVAGPLRLATMMSVAVTSLAGGDGSRFHVRCGLHLAGFAAGPGDGRTDWNVGRRRSRGEDGAADQNGGGAGYLHRWLVGKFIDFWVWTGRVRARGLPYCCYGAVVIYGRQVSSSIDRRWAERVSFVEEADGGSTRCPIGRFKSA